MRHHGGNRLNGADILDAALVIGVFKSANGAKCNSLGQRPRIATSEFGEALKARNLSPPVYGSDVRDCHDPEAGAVVTVVDRAGNRVGKPFYSDGALARPGPQEVFRAFSARRDWGTPSWGAAPGCYISRLWRFQTGHHAKLARAE